MKQILIVEDENSIADAIKFSVENEGFKYNHFTTIGQSREFLNANSVDLIILDVGLPDGTGFEFCKEIRKTSEVPIIFLTARNEEIDRVLGLEIGADDYLTKPFSPRELMARVKNIFRRIKKFEKIEGNIQKDIGLFRIDESLFQIFVKDSPLNLSKYEFGILKLFLDKPNRVFSRVQIMQGVWENPDMSLERTIDAHIKSIRKKIKEFSDTEYIITHRGLGYSFKVED